MRRKSLFLILIATVLAISAVKFAPNGDIVANRLTYINYTEEQTAELAEQSASVFSLLNVENNRIAGKANLDIDDTSAANQPATTQISKFTTYFDNPSGNRAHNIKISAKKLDKLTIPSGGKLSFNAVVGERTPENGFKVANIIVGGKYVKGYGGGVCQVSTTLYNAWVTAGLEVEKAQGHSLPSSYAELSRDATVSAHIDLVLVNSGAYPVDISAEVEGGAVSVCLYGVKGKYDYRIYTEKLQVIQPKVLPDIEIVVDDIGENEYEINEGACGYLTRAIIEVAQGGRVVSRRELRRDYYRPIDVQRIHKIKVPAPR